MRRVVITGMGIVSSIGSSLSEVLESLRNSTSGITHSPEMEELGFKSQVHGRPKINIEDILDKKTRRFMGEGAAWNYLAMRDAIEDAGLTPEEVSHEKASSVLLELLLMNDNFMITRSYEGIRVYICV